VRGPGLLVPVLPGSLPGDAAIGARVKLGVRPHDLAVGDVRVATSGDGFQGTLEVLEPLGWEVHLHVRGEFGSITARVERANLPVPCGPGQAVRLVVDPAKVHLFDAASGRRLGRQGASEA